MLKSGRYTQIAEPIKRLPMNHGVGHTIIGLVKQHESGVVSTHIQRNPHIMCAPKIPKADPLIGEAAKQDADIAASIRDIAKDQLAWEKERAIKQDPLVENIVSFIAE
ncbi:hypothetical protein [Nitrosospira sp. Is2]|uniref:hypothetical protein n=1 Tax=Nitrosospira sp. Is2 TaxID=3080532 RepID=UPI0029529D41|nr:hypothetical protein [Nitrosospira sp. Is2]WON74054.1 hypothetical protein R5L00_00755 [Nitrosospira sp. Is2]